MGLHVIGGGIGGGAPAAGIYATAATAVLTSSVTGDANARYELDADGTEKWGPGNAVADLFAKRLGVGSMRVAGTSALRSLSVTSFDEGTEYLRVGSSNLTAGVGIIGTNEVTARSGAATQVAIGAVGPASESAVQLQQAESGSTIYRDAAAQIRVSGGFRATSDIEAQRGVTAQTKIGAVGAGAESGILFTSSQDACINRVSAGRFHFSKVNANGFDLATGAYAGGTDVGGCLSFGTGAPVNGNGTNGDIYLRVDGGALTTIYQRRAAAWVGIV